MLHKHLSRLHEHIQEHGHKRALVMIMSSMVMMFYPYFSTKADFQLPSGGSIEIQYDHTGLTNTDVVATAIATSASGVAFTNVGENTHTFTENGTFSFEYNEAGMTGTVEAVVNWIDKTAPTATIDYVGTGPVVTNLQASEQVTITNNNASSVYIFNENGSFTFEFVDEVGNTGSALAEVTSISTGSNGGT